MTGLPRHGGDLAFARSRYGDPPDGWLDLSTGINPVGYRTAAIAADTLARLPDRGALERLLETARSAYSVASGASLLAAPGSEMVIRLLPLILPEGRVAILSPTYGSHAEAWRDACRSPAEIGDLADLSGDAAVVIVANPNNPDGRITEPEDLIRLAQRLAKRAGLLIVDEAFADVVPSKSLAPHLDKAPAVVLRSFGKFFGLAGLRLGFVAGPAHLLARLERLLGDWPVSTAAIAIGEAALADRAWQEETRDRLSRDAGELLACLGRHRTRRSAAAPTCSRWSRIRAPRTSIAGSRNMASGPAAFMSGAIGSAWASRRTRQLSTRLDRGAGRDPLHERQGHRMTFSHGGNGDHIGNPAPAI